MFAMWIFTRWANVKKEDTHPNRSGVRGAYTSNTIFQTGLLKSVVWASL